MLTAHNSALIVIDVQERLFPFIHQKEALLENLVRAIRGARVLEIPVLMTEQAPQKIGKTIPEIAALTGTLQRFEKITFSCGADARFLASLAALERRQVLIAGIETHVCVYQTAQDLVGMGYDVHVLADAVSSRTFENKQYGLDRIKQIGAGVTCAEMIACELLERAEGEKFKEVLKLIK